MNELTITSEHVAELNMLYTAFANKDMTKIMDELNRHCGISVDPSNDASIADAKRHRAALSKLKSDTDRIALQRSVKAIAQIAFDLTPIERAAAAEWKRIDSEIKRAENAPKVRLNEEVKTFVCFITGTLAQVNALSVEANGRGLEFENRGPIADECAKPIDEIIKED